MNQDNPNQSDHINLGTGSQSNSTSMVESIECADNNSDLNSNIPSVLAHNNPHDNSSISLLTTQPDSIHQDQVIEYNSNLFFQDLLEEAKMCTIII